MTGIQSASNTNKSLLQSTVILSTLEEKIISLPSGEQFSPYQSFMLKSVISRWNKYDP